MDVNLCCMNASIETLCICVYQEAVRNTYTYCDLTQPASPAYRSRL